MTSAFEIAPVEAQRKAAPKPTARPANAPSAERAVGDTIIDALERLFKRLDDEVSCARDGDAESVAAARASTARIAVLLDVLRKIGVAPPAKLRRRIAALRQKLKRARRYDAMLEAGLDDRSARKLEARRMRVHARLRTHLGPKSIRRSLTEMRRRIARQSSEAASSPHDLALALLRAARRTLDTHFDPAPKRKKLERLERATGRLLYTLDLFADMMTPTGNRLRSRLAEAHGHLVDLRDAEVALAHRRSVGTRRRRASLRASLTEKLSFIAEGTLSRELEAAVAELEPAPTGSSPS